MPPSQNGIAGPIGKAWPDAAFTHQRIGHLDEIDQQLHLAGRPFGQDVRLDVEVDAVEALVKRRRLVVVEDALEHGHRLLAVARQHVAFRVQVARAQQRIDLEAGHVHAAQQPAVGLGLGRDQVAAAPGIGVQVDGADRPRLPRSRSRAGRPRSCQARQPAHHSFIST
jgi:hypothetical protein